MWITTRPIAIVSSRYWLKEVSHVSFGPEVYNVGIPIREPSLVFRLEVSEHLTKPEGGYMSCV